MNTISDNWRKPLIKITPPVTPCASLSVHFVVLVVGQSLTMLETWFVIKPPQQAPEFRACLLCGLGAEALFLPCGDTAWKEMGCRGGAGWGAKERLDLSRSQSWGCYSHVLGSIGVQFWKLWGGVLGAVGRRVADHHHNGPMGIHSLRHFEVINALVSD